MSKEIEIQVHIEKVKPLLAMLSEEGNFVYENRQIDEYFTPPDHDFTAVRPLAEWLRLRDSDGKYSINYKYWHYDNSGRSHHCDEYESPIADIVAMRDMLLALKFRKLITVDKVRKAFNYKDWEIALDSIKNLGQFVEIEYKGSGKVDPKKETDKMVEFLKRSGCGKIERNYLGYPFQLMFPDEVRWEIV